MFRTLVLRRGVAEAKKIPYIYTNKYKARHSWPPDFSKLSPKYQFRLERKYKRRMKLKYQRPRWNQGIKIAQMTTILCTLVYGVLFLDWNTYGNPENPPFHSIRTWFFGLTDSIWTKPELRRSNEADNASPTSRTSS